MIETGCSSSNPGNSLAQSSERLSPEDTQGSVMELSFRVEHAKALLYSVLARLTCFTNSSIEAAVNCFVIEAMLNLVVGEFGTFHSKSAIP
jgi:hypothetical protein